VLYDLSAELSRVILFEETKAPPGGGDAPAPTERAPLSIDSLRGKYEGDASSRRSWRLGGGFLKFKSKGTLLFDGDTQAHPPRAADLYAPCQISFLLARPGLFSIRTPCRPQVRRESVIVDKELNESRSVRAPPTRLPLPLCWILGLF
jgi:hypothetical protein